jgi:hypothetical protein
MPVFQFIFTQLNYTLYKTCHETRYTTDTETQQPKYADAGTLPGLQLWQVTC